MPFDFETELKDGYLLFVVSGSLDSAEDILTFSDAIAEHALRAGCNRVILDERAAFRNVDQHDFILFGDRWVASRPPMGIKVAAVYTAEDARKFHWVETIVRNRSMVCRIFDDMAAAVRWLRAYEPVAA